MASNKLDVFLLEKKYFTGLIFFGRKAPANKIIILMKDDVFD